MPTVVRDGLAVLAFAQADDWGRWLAANHADAPGAWLKIAKKGSGLASATYAQALEEALRFGWIDGQKAALDERLWLQRFTPRGPRSRWSQINREKAEELMRRELMEPAGLEQVRRARADGRWEGAYAGQRSASVPADLRGALEASPAATAFFATLDRANRYAILYRVEEAKRPETRARRIAKFIAMLEAGERIHPSRR
jgi:uncharacterized protein YdeI (YjbR/CyaY-like superfamily)